MVTWLLFPKSLTQFHQIFFIIQHHSCNPKHRLNCRGRAVWTNWSFMLITFSIIPFLLLDTQTWIDLVILRDVRRIEPRTFGLLDKYSATIFPDLFLFSFFLFPFNSSVQMQGLRRLALNSLCGTVRPWTCHLSASVSWGVIAGVIGLFH